MSKIFEHMQENQDPQYTAELERALQKEQEKDIIEGALSRLAYYAGVFAGCFELCIEDPRIRVVMNRKGFDVNDQKNLREEMMKLSRMFYLD